MSESTKFVHFVTFYWNIQMLGNKSNHSEWETDFISSKSFMKRFRQTSMEFLSISSSCAERTTLRYRHNVAFIIVKNVR
jgi:hypothetical protein